MINFININGIIEIKTGLHIGGSKDTIEIGGMDNPIIKHPVTLEPYIPGSSLKGKMRYLVEFCHEDNLISRNRRNDLDFENEEGRPHSCKRKDCETCKIFGSASKEAIGRGATRLIVRDAHLNQEYKQRKLGETFLELKSENVINRLNGEATPRCMERIVSGALFDFELVYRVFEEEDRDLLPLVAQALMLVEQDALGGSTSRGSGKIEFKNIQINDMGRTAIYPKLIDWFNSITDNQE